MPSPSYSTATRKKPTTEAYASVVRDVRAGNFKPVYLLMGEEAFYIDRLANLIVNAALKPEERDFNLLTYFGGETDIDTVITAAKGYPLGAGHLVVLVREGHRLQKLERLEFYLRQVQPSTILVVCHPSGSVDRRQKYVSMIEKVGLIFESNRLYDSQLPAFIAGYLKEKNVTVDPAASSLLSDFVGADLSRMAGELDKLCIALPETEKHISPQFVQSHVGLSKDYNVFELQEALGVKDVLKVMQIASCFEKNPKANNIQMILPFLYKYFSQLMLAYYAPDKSERGLAAWLDMRDWQVRRNIMPAMKHYSASKVMHIITALRRTDARSKGVGNSSTTPGELMRELLFFILH